jgi:hypothetical protein
VFSLYPSAVGNETVAEDTLADGEKKAVAVAEVELADVEGAPAEDELELDAAFVLVFLFFFFLQLACPSVQRHHHRMQHLVRSAAACQMQLLLSCSNQTALP